MRRAIRTHRPRYDQRTLELEIPIETTTLIELFPPEFGERVPWAEAALSALAVPSTAGVLLVGSRAEALGTEVSDIDLLLLLEGDEAFIPSIPNAQVTVFRSGVITRFLLLLADGGEVDVEVVHAKESAPIEEALAILATLGETGSADETLTFPSIPAGYVRSFSRLASGHILAGHERVALWRKSLNLGLLQPYWAASNFVSAMALAEDAVALLASGCPENLERANLAARHSVDNLLLSSLAALGDVRLDLKTLPAVVARRSETTTLPAPLAAYRELAFPARDTLEGGGFPALVVRQAAELFAYFRTSSDMTRAATFIRKFGSGGRWNIDIFLDEELVDESSALRPVGPTMP